MIVPSGRQANIADYPDRIRSLLGIPQNEDLVGPSGPPGPQGEIGPQGPAGPTGPANTDASALSTGTVPDARLPARLQSGSSLSLADQPDGEGGAENTKAMTALRTKQQIDARFKTYTSSEISLVTSSVTTLTHGLGAEPKYVNAFLICKTAEKGYNVGAKVLLCPSTVFVGGGAQSGVQISKPNASTIDVAVGNYVPFIPDRSGGSATYITAANWRIIVEASL